jgi:glycosyltransferase involved in cell wall biosynthesis
VLGSLWEGGPPQVVFEALAAGLPIVGTQVGILPELGEAARTVPVGDHAALGLEMLTVASRAEIRVQMAAATSTAVRPMDECISDLHRLYDSLRRRVSHL